MTRTIHLLLTLGLAFLFASGLLVDSARGMAPQRRRPPQRPQPPAEEKPDEKESDEDTEEKEEDRFLVIQGGMVHTVSGPVLDGASILCKNGKIADIALTVDIPEDAEVLDATGYHVYPGLVAVDSRGLLSGGSPEGSSNVHSLGVVLGLAGGITTVVTGNTAAKLTFGTLDDMVIKKNVFTNLTYSTRNPAARRGLRESFDKLRDHLRKLEEYEREKLVNKDAKKPDGKWIKGNYATHLKLLKRETTGLMRAQTTHEIKEACELAERYDIRIVIRGAREGWTIARDMGRAGVSAILSLRPSLFSERVEPDQRTSRATGDSIENPRILRDAGVTVAVIPISSGIATWGVAGRDLFHLAMEAAFAVRGGLTNDEAVRTVTLDAARILDVDHRVGSIEVGKDADFAIVDGDLLHYMTLVRWTVVNGRIAYDKQKDTLFDHIRPGGDWDAPPPDDHWPRRLGEDWPGPEDAEESEANSE